MRDIPDTKVPTYLHSYSCSSQEPGPTAKEYSEVSIPGAQHLPPSSLAQMSTQVPKLEEELEFRAETPSPRLRTDRSTLTIIIVIVSRFGGSQASFIAKQNKITPGI